MEWGPIESAPKDGTPFLASGLNYGHGPGRHFAVAFYCNDDGEFLEGSDYESSSSHLDHLDFWMPLPDPPKPE